MQSHTPLERRGRASRRRSRACITLGVAAVSVLGAAAMILNDSPAQASTTAFILRYSPGDTIDLTGGIEAVVGTHAVFPCLGDTDLDRITPSPQECPLGPGGGTCVWTGMVHAVDSCEVGDNSAEADATGTASIIAVAGTASVSASMAVSGSYNVEAIDNGEPCPGPPCPDLSISAASSLVHTSPKLTASIPFEVTVEAQMTGSAFISSLVGACTNLQSDVVGTWSIAGTECEGASGELEPGALGSASAAWTCCLEPGDYSLTVTLSVSHDTSAWAACCQPQDSDGCATLDSFDVNLSFVTPCISIGGP